jgi:hypothetical protein
MTGRRRMEAVQIVMALSGAERAGASDSRTIRRSLKLQMRRLAFSGSGSHRRSGLGPSAGKCPPLVSAISGSFSSSFRLQPLLTERGCQHRHFQNAFTRPRTKKRPRASKQTSRRDTDAGSGTPTVVSVPCPDPPTTFPNWLRQNV